MFPNIALLFQPQAAAVRKVPVPECCVCGHVFIVFCGITFLTEACNIESKVGVRLM